MSEVIDYEWPSTFPDGVPNLDEVCPANGVVYRLVKNNPPNRLDFLIHREERKNYRYSKDQEALQYGISFWSNLIAIQRVKRNYPKPEQFGNHYIVSGLLSNDLGVVPKILSSDGHVTLWAQCGAKPHECVKNLEVE